MPIRFVDETGAVRDVIVEVGPATTIGDLARALDSNEELQVDGLTVAPAQPASSVLVAGAIVTAAGEVPSAPPGPQHDPPEGITPPQVEVSGIAGLDAGWTERFTAGEWTVGNGLRLSVRPVRAGALPWHDAAVDLHVIAQADDAVTVGAVVDPKPGQRGVHRRPPPVSPLADPEPIEPPNLPPPLPPPPALSWAAVLAPLPVAALMAVLFRPLFAVFAAMGPIIAVARWYEQRRRHRRTSRHRAALIAEMRRELARSIDEAASHTRTSAWIRHPHVAALRERAMHHSRRLWERRRGSPRFLHVAVGVAAQSYEPRFTGAVSHELTAPREMIDLSRPVPVGVIPAIVDLDAVTGLGLHGDVEACRAVARSIVLQLATLHGPSDVAVCGAGALGASPAWDWLKWLPHHRGADAAGSDDVVTVVLVDEAAGAGGPSRDVPSGRMVRVIAIAECETELPAACATLVCVSRTRRGHVLATIHGDDRPTPCLPAGISVETADAWARALAPMLDPDLAIASAGSIPTGISRLVGLDNDGADMAQAIETRWATRTAGLRTVLGVDQAGEPFAVDLVEDGPHTLIAGTTGAGKSELLRTLLVGLCLTHAPVDLHVALIDFKGGGAFDAIADLPHVVGLITDLDEDLVRRAIAGLRRELYEREERFRALGVSDIADLPASTPMARVMIVIDEFAVLARDHPDLLASLVDLAARGRSLGMHLVLATQRPSGVVDQKIRANTNLRIALRVQDPADSHDVIGTADASTIDRRTPGRAFVRIGTDSAVEIQVADTGRPALTGRACRVTPFWLGVSDPDDSRATATTVDTSAADFRPSELRSLVAAMTAVGEGAGSAAHRGLGSPALPLWKPPLPDRLSWQHLRAIGSTAEEGSVLLGLVDEPEHRTQSVWSWAAAEGGLLVHAASATEAARLRRSLIAAWTADCGPDERHLYIVAARADPNDPSPPHLGAWVGLDDHERLHRLISRLSARIAGRRGAAPPLLLILDNPGALLGTFDPLEQVALVDELIGIARDGPAVGVHLAMLARVPTDVPHRLGERFGCRLVLTLTDPAAWLTLGVKPEGRPLEMRAIEVRTGARVQLVEPPDDAVAAPLADERPQGLAVGETGGPEPVGVLPPAVSIGSIGTASLIDGALHLPFGLRFENLEPAVVELRAGESLLIVGRRGSGRTTALATVAAQVSAIDDVDVVLLDRCGRLFASRNGRPDVALGDIAEWLPEGGTRVGDRSRALLVVDDADRLSESTAQALTRLLERRSPDLHILASTSLEHARAMRAWVAPLRTTGRGLLLGGTPADADVLRAPLPPLPGVGVLPGRGHLVEAGLADGVQVARPEPGWVRTVNCPHDANDERPVR